MGLCKCPKRQVTNQFCFEHRVNVCENCMVNSHSKCIVQSYLQWLKDSDYDSTCTLCRNALESDDCVRLICYHVFHWHCLNEQQSALPNNTAPGGRTCPTCFDQIFPPPNMVSPVADSLRSRLRQTNWGQDEFALSLPPNGLPADTRSQPSQSAYSNSIPNESISKKGHATSSNAASASTSHRDPPKDHSVLSIDPNAAYYQASGSRKSLLQREGPIGLDRDDNKYKRRTPAEIFARWSRRFYVPSSRPIWRRTWFSIATGIAIFVLIIFIMASLGRKGNDIDSIAEENFPHA